MVRGRRVRNRHSCTRCLFRALLVVFLFLFFAVQKDVLLPRNRLKFTIGTIVRGDEWSGEVTDAKRAVLVSLKSFIRSAGSQRVVIFVDSQSSCDLRPDFLKSCVCQSISFCADSVYRLPTMDCVFDTLFSIAKTHIVVFVNGDIVLFDSFLPALERSNAIAKDFLTVGRRHRGDGVLNIRDPGDWHYYETHAKILPLDHGYAIDFFATAKHTYNSHIRLSLPPFVVGAWRWDNVLLSTFYKRTNATVIDATYATPVLHQLPNVINNHQSRRGAAYNDHLAHFHSGMDYMFGSIDFADIVLEDGVLDTSVADPFHATVRRAFQAGVLQLSELESMKDYHQFRLNAINAKLGSFENHVQIMRESRPGEKRWLLM